MSAKTEAATAAPTPRAAAERTQAAARRAGAAWNQHDRRALIDNVVAARDGGAQRLMVEYGGLRFRYDFKVVHGGAEADAADEVMLVGNDDVNMRAGQPQGGQRTHDAAAAQPATPMAVEQTTVPRPPASQPMAPAGGAAAAQADGAARDAEVARVARARRKRQKDAKKERERQRLAASAEAQRLAEELAKKEADEPVQFCPLWSTAMGQRQAFVRLAGEMSARIVAVNGPSTPSKRPVAVMFRETSYEVMVFTGTVACTMSPTSLGNEMLAMLASGVTEERVTTLLSRWSVPAPAGIAPT